MANLATRLISIILMPQSRGTLKASDLAGELGVSARTIHGYMDMLDDLIPTRWLASGGIGTSLASAIYPGGFGLFA
jgi:predicted DNA-binding transcriptional regulator YafY